MTPEAARLQVQGTAVAIDGAGVLLRGPSGAGKSSLALRLIDEGAVLIADDLAEIRRSRGRLTIGLPAAVDPRFRGAIERRGQGILKLPCLVTAPLALVVDLRRGGGASDRLCDRIEVLGLAVPLAVLDPFQPDTPAKLRESLRKIALRQRKIALQ
jgi:HPr kinase/phosphorylase